MADLQVMLGRRSDKRGADPAKAKPGMKPGVDEVQGQWACYCGIVCPWCWTIVDTGYIPEPGTVFTCWNCGEMFET